MTVPSEVERSLGRIEGQLQQLLVQMAQRDAHDEERHTALDARIRRTEAKVHYFSGGLALLAALWEWFVNGGKVPHS